MDKTLRYEYLRKLMEGDVLEFINSGTNEKFAEAIIDEVREKQFKDIDNEDFKGHEKFSSKQEMHKTYKGYYGEQVLPETTIKIIRFKLIR